MLRISVYAALVSLVSGTASISARHAPRPCGTYTSVAADTVLDITEKASQILVRPIMGRGPEYPAELRTSRIEGHVRASFVLDTMGRVIRHSVQITEESNRAFGRSVREFLTYAKFVPIAVNGRLLTTSISNMGFMFELGSR